MKNNSLNEIGNIIAKADKVLLFPHVNMDGDAFGSAVALCSAIRSLKKECHIIIEEKIPGNLQFLDRGYCILHESKLERADLSICIDCGDIGRISKRKDIFLESPINICIDHHETTEGFCQYNYIDPNAAATGQLIYMLLCEMGITINKEIGEAIFAAITTDTGNFQYSNTSKETHEIVAKLYDAGIDANLVSVEIYENLRMEKLLIKNKALNTLKTIDNGKCAIAFVTQAMLSETGATMDETDGIVETLRSISGVEIAAFFKEAWLNKIKVSLRAKIYGNVAEIASAFNGGGHEKAAGFTLNCSLEEAIELVSNEVIKNLEKYDNRSNF